MNKVYGMSFNFLYIFVVKPKTNSRFILSVFIVIPTRDYVFLCRYE